ncbi:MAG: fused MFS/spermidine synthase [Candidatus Brocadiia bacterium]
MEQAQDAPAPERPHDESSATTPPAPGESDFGWRRLRTLLLVLFLLSGTAALIYQVVWTHMLHLVFGVTSFAVATVLSSFMAGLALGSLYGGRYVDRSRRPMVVFCCLQIGIGGFALAFPLIVEGLSFLYVLVRQHWLTNFYVYSLFRFVMAFGVLLLPTTLMGATLPVLARFFVRRRRKLGSDLGALYSANNCGAVLGALAAGFVLIELLGLLQTSYLAAAVSICVGLAALALHRRHAATPAPQPGAEPPAGESEPEQPTYPRYVLHVVLWVFALEGFTSLAYEVVWTRILSASQIVITVYAYSLVVATFVAGLAIGSYLIRRFADRVKDLLSLLGGIEIAIGLTAVALLPLFKESEDLFYWAGVHLQGWGRWTLATAGWMGALMLVPTTLMGMTFPLVGKIYTVKLSELGRRVGKVGYLDTVGSIFGAFAGGFVLIPLLGMQKSVLAIAAINVAIGLAVVLVHPRLRRWRKLLVTGGLAVVCAVAWTLVPHDVQFLAWHMARSGLAEGIGYHLLHYEEGMDATVTVVHLFTGDQRVVAVNGVDVAGTGRVLETTQSVQAHLPVLLYEAQNGRPPRSALTIGLGSGGTSHSLSLHQNLEHIHCVELLDSVRRAAVQYFAMLNHGVFNDPRYRLFIEDARTYVRAARREYDIIMDDSVHPSFQGNASLYSRDFFRDCRRKLSDDGIMSVWMPVFRISADDYRMIFRAFLDVFPHATLWRSNNAINKHMVLVGTREPLSIDLGKFRQRMAEPAVKADLARVDLEDPYVLLTSLLMDSAALRAYSQAARPHTDYHPYLAYSCPRSFRRFYVTDPWVERIEHMRSHGTDVLDHITNLGDTPEERDQNRQRLLREQRIADHLSDAFALHQRGQHQQAAAACREALRLDADHKIARWLLARTLSVGGQRLLEAGELEMAQQALQQALDADPGYGGAHMRLAGVQYTRGDLPRAIASARQALSLEPHRASWRYPLAIMYGHAGRWDAARQQLLKLQEALPGNEQVQQLLQQLPAQAAKAQRPPRPARMPALRPPSGEPDQ